MELFTSIFECLEFFSEKHKGTFSLFCATHFISSIILLASFIAFLSLRKWFQGRRDDDKIFRYSIAGVLFFITLVYYLWEEYLHGLSVTSLPLNLCDIINLLTIFTLTFNKPRIANVVYYWAFLSTLQAIIFSVIEYGPMHFRFWHFFIFHFFPLLGNLYFFLIDKAEVSKNGINRSILILFLLSIMMLVVDLLSGQNWLYMVSSAPLESISNFLGFPLYTILWLIFNVLLIKLTYLLSKWFLKIKSA